LLFSTVAGLFFLAEAYPGTRSARERAQMIAAGVTIVLGLGVAMWAVVRLASGAG
jgi:hypothetical protein